MKKIVRVKQNKIKMYVDTILHKLTFQNSIILYKK